MPQAVITAEREWARVLARHVANQLPQAIRQVRDVQLTGEQIDELQKAFENINRFPKLIISDPDESVFHSEILQRIIFRLPSDFLKHWLVSAKRKIKLHTNSAKRRRVLKG